MSTLTFRPMSSRAVWLVLAALALAVVLVVASPAQPAAAACGAPATVNNETELNAAIAAFNAVAAGPCTFTIQLGADILVTSEKELANQVSGVNLVIEGAGHAVDAQGTGNRRVFFVRMNTYVTMNQITVKGGNLNNEDGAGFFLDGDVTGTAGAHLTLTNSTVTGNTVTGTNNVSGGGILVQPNATLTVRNSTISGNSSAQFGGGITSRGQVTLDGVTITGNSATSGGSGYGGFVGELTIRNTIIAGNTGAPDCRDSFGSVTDQGHNLVQSQNGCGFVNGVNGNIVGVSAELGPLANNGGPTPTHLPNVASPAIDAGDTTLTVDQRGVARPQGAADDIGAVEVETCPTSPWNASNEGELNFAIGCYNAATAPGVYTINVTQNITLTASTTAINNANAGLELQILGAFHTVDGQGTAGVRPFEIAANTLVKIGNMTVSGGNVPGGDGGGIRNAGILTLYNSTISANASRNGGGIDNVGTLTIEDSTIANNQQVGTGGQAAGIYSAGTLTIRNSTVSGNQAVGSAIGPGGIQIFTGSATFDSVTVANNVTNNPSGLTGGVSVGPGTTVTMVNTIVSDNSGPGADDNIRCSPIANSVAITYSLLQSANAACNVTNGVAGNIVGQAANLGPLANNGGPTQTHLPNAGSPALDAGDTALTVDQRGITRPQGAADDIGAVEVACAAFPVSVANEGQLNTAIGCYNALTTAGVYTINVTQDIPLTASTTVIRNTTTGVSLVIEGAGKAVDGQDTPGVTPFEIGGRTTVTMNDLTVTGGNMPNPIDEGGGIRNSGILTLNNATVTGNFAGYGGGIYSRGSDVQLTLNNTTVSSNRTSGDGGGINSNAALTVNDSTIQNNEADSDGGGVFIYGRPATISNTLVDGNRASSNGGGVYNRNGTVTIAGSTLSNNTAVNFGGGVRNRRGAMTIVDSTLSGNAVRDGGGGIEVNSGTLTVTGSTFANNEAENNAGTKGSGGGLQISIPSTVDRPPAIVSIKNSTFSGNAAGGNAADDGGGAMMVYTGTLTLDSVTVAGNSSAAKGGGIAQVGGTVSLRNTIVGDNTAVVSGPDLSGAITSADYNLVENTSGATFAPQANDITGADPALGPLAFNGGTTRTHLPQPGSPAINAGNTTLTVDQRGVSRPQGAADDIGAVEVVANPGITMSKTVGTVPGVCATTDAITVTVGTQVEYCFDVENTGDITLTNHLLLDPALGITATVLGDLPPGDTITVLVTTTITSTVSNTATWFSCNLLPIDAGEGAPDCGEPGTTNVVSDTDTALVTVINPSIALTKTVGTNPAVCATTDAITVTAGTEVVYCFTVANTGDQTLTSHLLEDPALGISTVIDYALSPGASVSITATASLTQTTVNAATWTACNLNDPLATCGGPGSTNVVSDTDTATVTVVNPSITMSKTVGTVPGVCATTDTITVAAGTTVYYCYTVTNTGDVALPLHDLVDDQLGTLLNDFAYNLAPGATVSTVDTGLVVSITASSSVTNTAVWTAFVDANVTASFTDTATVIVVPPTAVRLTGLEAVADRPAPVRPWLLAMALAAAVVVAWRQRHNAAR